MDKNKQAAPKKDHRYGLVGVLILVSLVTAVFYLKEHRVHEKAKKPAPLPAVAYYPVPKTRGPDSAPVKIVEYSDFECPSCRVVEETLREIFKAYPGKVQLTFRHYPLTNHKWSIYAHQAAECMHIQGRFWPFHDMVYDKQLEWASGLTPPVALLAKYAQSCGANMDLFSSCMADENVAKGIYAEKEEGNKRDVSATPTFFIGEQRFVGPVEMRERGQNAVRKVLGLAPLPVSPKPAATSRAPAAPASPDILPPPLIQPREPEKK